MSLEIFLSVVVGDEVVVVLFSILKIRLRSLSSVNWLDIVKKVWELI